MVGMAWPDHLFRWSGGGSVLNAATGSKGVRDIRRLNYSLMGGRSEVLTNLVLNFNDENERLRRHMRGMRTVWPSEYPPGTGQGFLRQHKDHPLEAQRIWKREADRMVDHALRLAQYHGTPVSALLPWLSGWAGHTPITQYFTPRLAEVFPNPTARVGLIEIPTEPACLENLRDLGTAYPDPQALGLHAIILTKQPPDDAVSLAQDWELAFGLAVLIGNRRAPVANQPSAGDALATLARFSKGFIRASFGLERVPLLSLWYLPFRPLWRISRLPLPKEVGSAMAQAVRAATAAGANQKLPWVMTVGVPLSRRSRLWQDQELPTISKQHAADILGLKYFPTNIKVIWSSLLAVPEYDHYHAPVATMALWPSQTSPDPLIAEELAKPSLLVQQEVKPSIPTANGPVRKLVRSRR
jgi:hypothetical protein